MEFDPESIVPPGAKIKVVGVGGGGGNAVNTMIRTALEGVDFVACNTDVQSLRFSLAPTKIQVGKDLTRGLGAGADPDVGREAAIEDRQELQEYLEGADMVFITAGMGGGTGTGGAAVVAQIARELGALTVGVVTKPFTFEGKRRKKHAETGVARLRECVDTLITIPNQRLLELATPDLSMIDAFKLADDVLVNAVKGISDIINIPGTVNVDFADVKTVMSCMGQALMGIGMCEGENRASEAAQRAIRSPLLEDIDIEGATGVLVNITAGSSLSLMEVNEACSVVQEAAHEDANFIFGAVIDENLGDAIRVTVIATGFPVDSDERDAIEQLKQQNQMTNTVGGAAHNPFNTRLTEPALTKRKHEMSQESLIIPRPQTTRPSEPARDFSPTHKSPESVPNRPAEPTNVRQAEPTNVRAPEPTPVRTFEPVVSRPEEKTRESTNVWAEESPQMPTHEDIEPASPAQPQTQLRDTYERPNLRVNLAPEDLEIEPQIMADETLDNDNLESSEPEFDDRSMNLSGGGDESEELARWTMGFTPPMDDEDQLESEAMEEGANSPKREDRSHQLDDFLPLNEEVEDMSDAETVLPSASIPSDRISGATIHDEYTVEVEAEAPKSAKPIADSLFDNGTPDDSSKIDMESNEPQKTQEDAPLDALFSDKIVGSEIDRKIDEALEMAERLKAEGGNAKEKGDDDDLDIPAFLRNGMKDLPLS